MTQELTRLRLNNHIGATGQHGIVSRSRSLFLPATLFYPDGGSFGTIGSSPNQVRIISMADAATQGAFCMFQLPADHVTGEFTVRPVCTLATTASGSHNIRWQSTCKLLNLSDLTAAGTQVLWTDSVPGIGYANYGEVITGVSSGLSVAAKSWVRLAVHRLGADALDTCSVTLNLIGVQIDYTADR